VVSTPVQMNTVNLNQQRGPGAGLRGGRVRGDVRGREPHLWHHRTRPGVSYYNDDSKRTKGMYRQRIQKAWGHMAHRGWARLLLNPARDLITHGPAHRGANGAAMTTDEDD